ncbi:hypothetical protein [Clostridium sp.]
MIKKFKNEIYIVSGLLVFAILMLIDLNTDTVAMGEFLLIIAVGGIIITAVDMLKYYIRKNYYRKPQNKDEQRKIEAIIFRQCINADGIIEYEKLKEHYNKFREGNTKLKKEDNPKEKHENNILELINYRK